MGHLCSSVGKIGEISLEKIANGKAVQVDKIAVFADRYFIVKDKKGNLHTNHPGLGGRFAYLPNGEGWEPSYLKALVALGEIKKKDVDTHIKEAKARYKEQRKRDSIQQIKSHAKRAGIELSKEQLEAMADKS